jgi:hypothetical protein
LKPSIAVSFAGKLVGLETFLNCEPLDICFIRRRLCRSCKSTQLFLCLPEFAMPFELGTCCSTRFKSEFV